MVLLQSDSPSLASLPCVRTSRSDPHLRVSTVTPPATTCLFPGSRQSPRLIEKYPIYVLNLSIPAEHARMYSSRDTASTSQQVRFCAMSACLI